MVEMGVINLATRAQLSNIQALIKKPDQWTMRGLEKNRQDVERVKGKFSAL